MTNLRNKMENLRESFTSWPLVTHMHRVRIHRVQFTMSHGFWSPAREGSGTSMLSITWEEFHTSQVVKFSNDPTELETWGFNLSITPNTVGNRVIPSGFQLAKHLLHHPSHTESRKNASTGRWDQRAVTARYGNATIKQASYIAAHS